MRKFVYGIVLLLVIVGVNSAYYANEGEYAIIKRFDKVVSIRDYSGMGFKVPLLDSKTALTKKLIMYDLMPSEVLTKDKKSMIADTYAVWRIEDPLKFLQTAGNIREMERRLDATVYGGLKTTIGAINQMDIIESRTNNNLNKLVLANAVTSLDNYGVELLDVQVKKFDLPSSNKNAVFARMISERQQIAATFTAEGQEEANKIRNTADKEKAVIVSQAQSMAAQIEAEGEEEFMRILASAYNSPERAEFYEFIRTLDALKITMAGDKTLILTSDVPIVKGLYGFNK